MFHPVNVFRWRVQLTAVDRSYGKHCPTIHPEIEGVGIVTSIILSSLPVSGPRKCNQLHEPVSDVTRDQAAFRPGFLTGRAFLVAAIFVTGLRFTV